MKLLHAAVAFVVWLLLGTAWAQTPVTLGHDGSYALTRAFSYYEDQYDVGLKEVLSPEIQKLFRPVPAKGSNFGLSGSSFWLRADLKLAPGAPREWLLEVAYPPLDRIELYVPDGRGAHVRELGGDTVPPAGRMAHRNHVLRVSLPAGDAHTLYMRISSQGPVSAPTRLWQPAALWASDQVTFSALSLYFGLLLGLLAYNLLLYFSVRDRAFVLYVAFVAGMAVAQAALTGLGPRFLWGGWPWWVSVAPNTGNSFAAIFGLLFAREFLDCAQRMPRIDRLMRWLVYGWMASLAAALALPYIVSTVAATVLAPAAVALLVAAGVQGLRLRQPGAGWFLAAWTMLLLGVALLTLHNTGLLPSNVVTANALLIGSALEMVLLSFALGDRIHRARREKEQAQVTAEAEHAMVEALKVSEERLKTALQERETILESSIVGIAFLTPGGRLRWANKAMMEVFGASGQAVTSMEPFYLSREQYLRVGGEVAACVARGEVYETELQVQQFDGTRIWISLSGKAVSRTDLGQGTVWVIMNITQRKELEERLQATMSEREAILNNALVGIVLSMARTHEWVNEKFARMMGYEREQLIGSTSQYIHASTQAWEAFGVEARAALIATGTHRSERQLRRRDGSLFWVEMGGTCIRPNDPDSGVIWTFLDITERKKSEEEIREALEQQKALNELRTRFVAMTSHEFRTPLAGILSAEELLRHYGDRLPQAERIEILDGIADGVQRMSRMMDRVLLLGRADAQLLDFSPAMMDLPALCERLLGEAMIQHGAAACEVSLECAPGVGIGLYDEKLLRHILGNLLSNAIKYSPHGGEVRLQVSQDDGQTVFEVADTGIGIPEDEISHLFESFHRASNVGAIPGTGLGLAIVKNAVDMHAGTITVVSQPGRGTVFTVKLPNGGGL